MPANRLALIRYKSIDDCLRNRGREWTLEDLRKKCSEDLQKHEGIYNDIGLRTVQLDIQNMRSEKMGYEAPIIVVNKKYYTYDDPEYSIFNMPLTAAHIKTLAQITYTLNQFEGFSEFADMAEELRKIESRVYSVSHPARTIIDFEKNRNVKGMRFLNKLYTGIRDKDCLSIVYKPIDGSKLEIIHISPYLLKEYHNRWFLFGKKSRSNKITELTLDRMLGVSISEKEFFEEGDFDADLYFRDQIGITHPPKAKVEKVVFRVERSQVHFISTKPFHSSQQLVEEGKDSSVFSIKVIHNFELEKELLGYGEAIEVLRPLELRKRFKERTRKLAALYK